MSLIDVETSAEAIQEDEELIEAVEQLVETAAVSLYTEVAGELSTIIMKWRTFIETTFPFLVYWREDEALFWSDMFKLGVSSVLFVLAFVLLAPSHRGRGAKKRKRSLSWLRFGRAASFDTMIHLNVLKSSTSTPLSGTNMDDDHFYRHSRRHSTTVHRLGTSGQEFGGITTLCTGQILVDEEETEEEMFEKMWPTIAESNYRRLVLPPSCKLVEKPKNSHKKEDKKKGTRGGHGEDENDEDHPLTRLRNYGRQFAHLIMKLLRYDYVGAGWTLINWFQACLKTRQNRVNGGPDDYDDDDESDADSLKSLKRRDSATSEMSSSTAGAQSLLLHVQHNFPHNPSIPRKMPRPKKDNAQSRLIAITDAIPETRAKTERGITVEDDDVNCSNDTREPSAATSLTPLLTVEVDRSITSQSMNGNDEEKKESPADLPPGLPSLPASPVSNERRTSEGSDYFDSEQHQHDVGERIASRLTLARRVSKQKDALEIYRQRPSRIVSSSDNSPYIEYQQPQQADSSTQNLASNNRNPSAYFFETINSQESLRKLAVEVPVPDCNGYILGDHFLPDNSYTPLLVFVNSRSGPQQGHLLITQLRRLLNPIQIWDLADGGPGDVLQSFSALTRLRILVCGGDGTVSWIVSTIETMQLQRWPPIAILPLGTGNDLARIHGWGGGYNNESLIGILEQVAESYISWLDRWEISVINKKGKVKSVKSFFNYLGVGADAQAALQVHMLRESRPQLFFSRVVNKAWYGVFGAEDIIKATSVNLPNDITLFADGVEVPLPADSQGIILLNIDSYAGGTPLWSQGVKGDSPGLNGHLGGVGGGFRRSRSLDELRRLRGNILGSTSGGDESLNPLDRVDSVEDLASMALSEEEKFRRVTACDRPSSCQDGLLDIVSVRGAFHLGQIRVGLSNAQLLCQCREAKIVIKRKMSVQTDGEPWRQNACTIQVKRKQPSAIMLHRSADHSNGVETEVANLLDWAEDKGLIDGQVHGALMKEFSRRIESKTRQRRVRSQDTTFFSLKRAIGSTGNFHGSMGASSGNIMF